MDSNELVNIVSSGGLAAAGIYAARYLAAKLDASHTRVVELLTGTIAEANKTMAQTNETMREVRDAMRVCNSRIP